MAEPSLPLLNVFYILIIFTIAIVSASSSPSLGSPPSSFSPSKKPLRFLSKFSRGTRTQRQHRYEIRYFSQRLDHFSFAELPWFSQRYLISTEHWMGASRLGPIFLSTGGERDIEGIAADNGFVWEIAPRFGAMVLYAEVTEISSPFLTLFDQFQTIFASISCNLQHRYYGESMPYGSKEETYRNASTMSYLTAEQALADFAVLVTELKRNLSAEACPVVTFGGSYGGSKPINCFSNPCMLKKSF